MSSDLINRLTAPFPPATVSWRVGATTQDKSRGMALAYIDARDVQDRLNEVCGHEWQVKHHYCGGEKLACEIGIKIDGEWIWRGDGAGQSDVEAEKGAFSDSFKRAAVRWCIGRYLYDIESPWVDLEKKGNSYIIAPREMSGLRSLLTGNAKSAEPPTRTTNGKHPRWDYAGARFRELENAFKGAETEKTVNDIAELNKEDLKLIAQLHPPSYNRLVALHDQVLERLRRPPGFNEGSAPELMGEP